MMVAKGIGDDYCMESEPNLWMGLKTFLDFFGLLYGWKWVRSVCFDLWDKIRLIGLVISF